MEGPRKLLWLGCAVFLCSFAVRTINCQRGILSDEIITFWVSQMPAGRIVEERLAHNHLPTYFLLMRQWVSVAGATELTLRLPSMLCGAASIAALFLICARRFPIGLSLLAAGLLGLNATHLFVSQWARMYASTALIEVLFFGCFLNDLRNPSRRGYLAYSIVVVLGCSMHLLFLQMALVASALLLWEGLRCRRAESGLVVWPRGLDGKLLRYTLPFLVGGLLFLIWAAHAQALSPHRKDDRSIPWMEAKTAPVPIAAADIHKGRTDADEPTRKMLRVAFGDFYYWPFLQTGWPKYAMRLLLYSTCGVLLWAAFRKRPLKKVEGDLDGVDADRWRAKRFALLWAVLPPLLMVIGAVFFQWVPAPSPRWLVGAAAAWAVLLACGCWKMSCYPLARTWAVCFVVGVQLFIGAGWLLRPGDGLREALTYWAAQVKPGEKTFLAHQGYIEQALKFERIDPPNYSPREGILTDALSVDAGTRALATASAGSSTLWVVHYRFPDRASMERSMAALPGWRWELAFRQTATSVYRLSRNQGAS